MRIQAGQVLGTGIVDELWVDAERFGLVGLKLRCTALARGYTGDEVRKKPDQSAGLVAVVN